MFRVTLSTFLLLIALVSPSSAEEDVVRFGFEGGDLQGWKVVAGEFSQPVCQYGVLASGTCPSPAKEPIISRRAALAMGRTGADPDRMGGVIESPVFVVQGKEATFLLGGVAAQLTLHDGRGRQVRALRSGLAAS